MQMGSNASHVQACHCMFLGACQHAHSWPPSNFGRSPVLLCSDGFVLMEPLVACLGACDLSRYAMHLHQGDHILTDYASPYRILHPPSPFHSMHLQARQPVQTGAMSS